MAEAGEGLVGARGVQVGVEAEEAVPMGARDVEVAVGQVEFGQEGVGEGERPAFVCGAMVC